MKKFVENVNKLGLLVTRVINVTVVTPNVLVILSMERVLGHVSQLALLLLHQIVGSRTIMLLANFQITLSIVVKSLSALVIL